MPGRTAHKSNPETGILSVPRLVSVGLLAGLAGGGLAAMLFAAVLTTATSEVASQPLTGWLLQVGFAAMLAGMMGAWAGAQTGIALGLLLGICRHRCGHLLLLAPLCGLVAGLLHGELASIDRIPGIQPENNSGSSTSILFYLAVQFSAALSASWWLDACNWTGRGSASSVTPQLPKFSVCDHSPDDDNQ